MKAMVMIAYQKIDSEKTGKSKSFIPNSKMVKIVWNFYHGTTIHYLVSTLNYFTKSDTYKFK